MSCVTLWSCSLILLTFKLSHIMHHMVNPATNLELTASIWPSLLRSMPTHCVVVCEYVIKNHIHCSVEKIHSVGTINNVETSYFTQLKMCYLMTTFRCPSDILITSWLFTAWWSTWPGNHLVPRVAELVGSRIPIHARQCLPDPKCLFYTSHCQHQVHLRRRGGQAHPILGHSPSPTGRWVSETSGL